MVDIFLSYASANRANAETLANVLTKLGWTVWWDDKLLAGTTYRKEIEKNLKAAKCVIVLWTKESVASKWVTDEAKKGAEREILIPILLENIEIPLGFGEYQHARLIGWRSTSQFHPEFQKLLKSLTALLGRPPNPPKGPPFIRDSINPDPKPDPAEESNYQEGSGHDRKKKFFILGAAVLSAIAIWVLGSIIDFPPDTSNSGSSEPSHPEMIAKDKIEENYKKGEQLYDAGNYTEAFQWLEIAANEGHSEAMKKVILMLMENKVIDQNEKKLNEWISKAKALEEKKQE